MRILAFETQHKHARSFVLPPLSTHLLCNHHDHNHHFILPITSHHHVRILPIRPLQQAFWLRYLCALPGFAWSISKVVKYIPSSSTTNHDRLVIHGGELIARFRAGAAETHCERWNKGIWWKIKSQASILAEKCVFSVANGEDDYTPHIQRLPLHINFPSHATKDPVSDRAFIFSLNIFHAMSVLHYVSYHISIFTPLYLLKCAFVRVFDWLRINIDCLHCITPADWTKIEELIGEVNTIENYSNFVKALRYLTDLLCSQIGTLAEG